MLRLLFGIDVRSLALFRVCLGLVILYDLWQRVWDWQAHMTDVGVILRATNLRNYAFLTPGLYNIDGTTCFAAILFILTVISAGCVAVGYKTFLSTIMSYVLMSSLHIRHLRIGNGGDKLLRHLLLWSIFVPSSAVCSIDSLSVRSISPQLKNWRQVLSCFRSDCSRSGIDYLHVSVGSFALLFQTVLMYLVTYYLKDGIEWTTTYYAVYLTLCVNQWVSPLGLALRHLADASPFVFESLRFVTMITPWLQVGAVFLLCPLFTTQVRIVLILLLGGFQLGLALSLDVLCVFPWASIAGTLVFLPPWIWERCLRSTPPAPSNLKSSISSTTKENQSRPTAEWSSSNWKLNLTCVLFMLLHGSCLMHKLGLIGLPPFLQHLEFTVQANQDWTMFSNELGGYDGWYTVPSRFTNGSLIDMAPTYAEMGIPLVVPAPDRVYCTTSGTAVENPQWQCGKMPPEQQHRKRFSGRWLELLNNNKPWTDPALFDFADYLCRVWNTNRPIEQQIAHFEIYYVQRKLGVSRPGEPDEQFPGDAWMPLETHTFASHKTVTRTRAMRLCETRCPLPGYNQTKPMPPSNSDTDKTVVK